MALLRRLRRFLTGTQASRDDPQRSAIQAASIATGNALYPSLSLYPSGSTFPSP